MIARTWSGKVPADHADGFYRHLIKTGVADYRRQPGCVSVALWRRREKDWVHFTLLSEWTDMAAIRSYAGDTPEVAVLYPDDEQFQLVPDLLVTHYEVLRVD